MERRLALHAGISVVPVSICPTNPTLQLLGAQPHSKDMTAQSTACQERSVVASATRTPVIHTWSRGSRGTNCSTSLTTLLVDGLPPPVSVDAGAQHRHTNIPQDCTRRFPFLAFLVRGCPIEVQATGRKRLERLLAQLGLAVRQCSQAQTSRATGCPGSWHRARTAPDSPGSRWRRWQPPCSRR